MSGLVQRQLGVFFVAVAAGCCVLKFAPGSDIDRTAFTTVVRGFANPPFFISGNGSHAAPWQLRTLTHATRSQPQHAPAVVSLGDDPDGFFQSSPHAPIDLAVILSNFHRLGVEKAGIATVLAWESADAIGLAALEKALARFDSLALAAPLSRSAVPAPVLPSFRRASLPLAAITGDSSQVPTVNRCPIPDLILGGDKALAGFSVLESEPSGKHHHLIARWDDRVVFSFAIITLLQRLDLSPEGVEVRLGESLKLSPTGPVVPIDAYGRLAISIKPTPAHVEISAESIVDAAVGAIPETALPPLILRDDRSAAEPATRDFSKNLTGLISAISAEAGLGEVSHFRRPSTAWELGILGFFALALALVSGTSFFFRNLSGLLLGGLCLAAQWIGLCLADVWLPGMAILAAGSAAMILANLVAPPDTPSTARTTCDPEIPQAPQMEPITKPMDQQKSPPLATPASTKKSPGKKRARSQKSSSKS